MIRVNFITGDGTSRAAEAEAGDSVMEVALAFSIDGILAECGGACSCGTCRVLVDPAWLDRVGRAEDMELAMLEDLGSPSEEARLGCQIVLSPDLDGLTVTVAPQS